MRGQDFPGQLIRAKNLVGFYATRYVEAEDPKAAEFAALDLLRSDPALQLKSEKLWQQEPRATVIFEEIVEIDPNERSRPNTGITWFRAE